MSTVMHTELKFGDGVVLTVTQHEDDSYTVRAYRHGEDIYNKACANVTVMLNTVVNFTSAFVAGDDESKGRFQAA